MGANDHIFDGYTTDSHRVVCDCGAWVWQEQHTVTMDGNGGSGDMSPLSVKKGAQE